jgi:hypothetical protein
MNEAHVKAMMVKSVKAAGGYARRVEDQYLVGFPDTILIPKGYPVFFAEVKIVKGQQLAPSPRQYVELCRIADATKWDKPYFGIPVIIGYKDGVFYFHEPVESAPLRDCFSVTSGIMNFNDQLIQYYHGRLKL